MAGRIEKDLAQAVVRLQAVVIRMRVEPGLQFCRADLRRGLGIGNSGQFLGNAAAHDRIVAIKLLGEPLAVIHLLAHPGIDQPFQFIGRRRPMPGPPKLGRQRLDAVAVHHDFIG